MNKHQKVKRDHDTIKRYRKQLINERQVYTRMAQAYSTTDHKSRAQAIGECALQLIEDIRLLNSQKQLVPGSLYYTMTENKVKDTDGKKGFEYTMTYFVKANEAAWDKEQINAKLYDLYDRLQKETQEMFPDEPAEEQKTDPEKTE